MKRKLALMAAAAIAFAMVASPAAANCLFANQFKQFSGDGIYGYIAFGAGESDPGGTFSNAHRGKFWLLGSGGNNGASCDPNSQAGANPAPGWLTWYFYWYLNGDLTNGCVAGCPSDGDMAIIVEDEIDGGANARFAVLVPNYRPTRGIQYDMSPGTSPNQDQNWPQFVNAVDLPRPRVTSSSRNGTTVDLNISFDDVFGGYYDGDRGTNPGDVITGINLYQQTRQKADAAPGRDSADGWSLATTVANGGSTALGVDCSDPTTLVHLAAGLQLADGFTSDLVSAATVVECDPTLADPKAPRFKIVDRPDKPGRGDKFQPGVRRQ